MLIDIIHYHSLSFIRIPLLHHHIQNIATISATQNSITLNLFSQLLHAALTTIQPTTFITTASRSRMVSMTNGGKGENHVLVGDGLAKDWNATILDYVGMRNDTNLTNFGIPLFPWNSSFLISSPILFYSLSMSSTRRYPTAITNFWRRWCYTGYRKMNKTALKQSRFYLCVCG